MIIKQSKLNKYKIILSHNCAAGHTLESQKFDEKFRNSVSKALFFVILKQTLPALSLSRNFAAGKHAKVHEFEDIFEACFNHSYNFY